MLEKIEHKTLNDRAYDTIKASLIAGRFAPRQVLVIRTLAELYGISTTPVREALQRLVGEGLLVMLANRSIAVPDWEVEKFTELLMIRCELEGFAAKLAATQIPDAQIEELSALATEIAAASASGDHKSYVTLNQRFHFSLYLHANSPRLMRIIENLWGEIGVYLNELFSHPGFKDIADSEHQAIIEALRARDAEAVRSHLVADISKAAEFLLPRIRELTNS